MPRKRLTDRPRNITISLSESLVEEVEDRLKSVSGKVPYGAWRQLTTQLLKQWLKKNTSTGEATTAPTLDDF